MLAEASYWITWFPGALLAAFGFLALVWKALEYVIEAKATLKQARETMPLVLAEFSPNHGGSMKDRVEALHEKTDELAYKTAKWQREHARDDDRRFGKVEGSLERIEDKLAP